MNEEMLKTTLLEIIKEAENLPENELEVIPGTRIHVKKGRVDEFKANARFYYGLKNNVIVNNDDYIKEVYYELSDELARVEGEHVLSKAYELYSMNKSELDRLDALNRSLAINANDREKYRKALADLNSRNISDPKTWEEITNLQNSLKTLSENEIIIRNAIAEIKDKVNNETKKVEEQNGPLIKEVEQELTDLIKKAKATPNATLAEGKEILASDLEEYNLLSRKYAILKNANPNSNLVEVNGALINSEQAEEYKEVAKELEEAKIKKGTSSSGQSSSASTSSEEESKKKDTPSSSTETLTSEEEKSNEESKSSEEDKKKSPKEPLKRKAVKNIRKCKPETINWWKKNWKKLALIGVSSFVVLYTLSTLAPTIVYANSCLAMANPALSGVLGGINSTIINTLGLTLGELNLNVAASQAFVALATALGKVGIIGIGTVGAVKGIKGLAREDENRLPDPNRKTVARRILDLGEQLIDKSKELGKNLSAKASEFTENLAYATNANNMELEKEVMDAKMGFDPDIKDVEPLDDNFEEIEENVQNQIEEEKRKIIEDRINERFNRIKHAEDAEYIRPTALSDEPIIKGPASEPTPVTITIPTDDEIYATFSDKDVQLGRVDNYIDAMQSGDTKKASEYQQLVLKDTNIDLSKYNMNNYEELVQARSDVANFMNQIDITKRSR